MRVVRDLHKDIGETLADDNGCMHITVRIGAFFLFKVE